MSFLDAATGRRWCLWPMSGAGAEMVVCGDPRDTGCSYCATHRAKAFAGKSFRQGV